MEDDAIRSLVTRLARPHRSGGEVVERAAILAEGADFQEVMAWILAHDGTPEQAPLSRKSGSGLHGGKVGDGAGASDRPPVRFIFPAGGLVSPPPA